MRRGGDVAPVHVALLADSSPEVGLARTRQRCRHHDRSRIALHSSRCFVMSRVSSISRDARISATASMWPSAWLSA